MTEEGNFLKTSLTPTGPQIDFCRRFKQRTMASGPYTEAQGCFSGSPIDYPVELLNNNQGAVAAASGSRQGSFEVNDSFKLDGSNNINHDNRTDDSCPSSRTLYIPGPPYASAHCPDRWSPAEGSIAKSAEDMAYQYLYPVPSFLANLRQRNTKAAAGQAWSPRGTSCLTVPVNDHESSDVVEPQQGASSVSVLRATPNREGREFTSRDESAAALQFATPRSITTVGVPSKFNSSSMFAAETNGYGLLTPGFSIMDEAKAATAPTFDGWAGCSSLTGAAGTPGSASSAVGMMRDLLVPRGGTGDNIWTLPKETKQEQPVGRASVIQAALGGSVSGLQSQLCGNYVPLGWARSPGGSAAMLPALHPRGAAVVPTPPVRLMARFPHTDFTGSCSPIAGRILDEPVVQQSFATGPALALEGATMGVADGQSLRRPRKHPLQEGRETSLSCACIDGVLSFLKQSRA